MMESFEQKAYDSFGEVVINKNLINSAGFSARAIFILEGNGCLVAPGS